MRKFLALDANLLILLIVGLTNERYISIHKRTRGYSTNDYILLSAVISRYSAIAVTPHALSEASNLLRQIDDPARLHVSLVFRAFMQTVKEVHIPSKDASARPEYLFLGLSDSALLELAEGDFTLLSADAKLCLSAANAGCEAVNFNHLRNF